MKTGIERKKTRPSPVSGATERGIACRRDYLAARRKEAQTGHVATTGGAEMIDLACNVSGGRERGFFVRNLFSFGLILLVPLNCAVAQPDFVKDDSGQELAGAGAAETRAQQISRAHRTIILALDSSSAGQSAQNTCDISKMRSCEILVQDNILWRVSEPDNPASKHWLQENLDKLCACTADPYATVNCFQDQVNNKGKTWRDAIALCRAGH